MPYSDSPVPSLVPTFEPLSVPPYMPSVVPPPSAITRSCFRRGSKQTSAVTVPTPSSGSESRFWKTTNQQPQIRSSGVAHDRSQSGISGFIPYHSALTFKAITSYIQRLLLIILVFLSFFPNHVLSQNEPEWRWQSPYPQGNDLKSVWTQGSEWIYAVGDLGTIVESNDGGLTWENRYLENVDSLLKVQFVSPVKGYLLVYYENEPLLFKTDNRGKSWRNISNLPAGVRDFAFIDNLAGWLVCYAEEDFVWKTVDGGVTWRDHTPSEFPTDYYPHIQFLDNQTGWLYGRRQLLKTIDSGEHWTIIRPDSNSIQVENGHFLDELNGWTCGLHSIFPEGIISRTRDGGLTWESQIIVQMAVFYSIHFINNRIGAAGYAKNIYATSDGGKTWSRNPENYINTTFPIIRYSDQENAFAVGKGGQILCSRNGGIEWNYLVRYRPIHLTSVFAFTSKEVWIAGHERTVRKTMDGGVTWSDIDMSLINIHAIKDILFHSSLHGLIAGTYGRIYYTFDGGDSWERSIITDEFHNDIIDFEFIDSLTGWAACSNGTLLNTENGGESWQISKMNIPLNRNLLKVHFIDRYTGWVVWSGGVIHTSDGGGTWSYYNHNFFDSGITDVYFIDNLRGFSVGGWTISDSWSMEGRGKIWLTENAGQDWSLVDSTSDREFTTIDFVNESEGWTCGYEGTVYHTKDGGHKWYQMKRITRDHLWDIDFIDNEDGWAVGIKNAILKFGDQYSTIKWNQTDHPKEMLNLSCYPNPFNNCTTLTFKLPKEEMVRVRIINLSGQVVKELLHNELSAGFHTVSWEGLNNQENVVASGIYFCCLTVNEGGMVNVQKLVFLK